MREFHRISRRNHFSEQTPGHNITTGQENRRLSAVLGTTGGFGGWSSTSGQRSRLGKHARRRIRRFPWRWVRWISAVPRWRTALVSAEHLLCEKKEIAGWEEWICRTYLETTRFKCSVLGLSLIAVCPGHFAGFVQKAGKGRSGQRASKNLRVSPGSRQCLAGSRKVRQPGFIT